MSTYNRRKYLPSVLKDLQAQTLSNWKLIIINDGGDDVEDIVAGFSDARIEYYDRQHKGKAAQLNYAMSLVESKYIGYLDDDDRMMSNHYELLYRAAEANGADFVYSNVKPVVLNFEDDSIIAEMPVNDKDIKWEDIRLHNQINHSTILHTKVLAEKVGLYDERMKVLIDFDYIKRLASLSKPIHVHATTYQWNLRQDKSGQIQTISGLWEREPEVSAQSLMAFFEKDPISLVICYQEHGNIIGLKQQIEALNSRLSQQQVLYQNMMQIRDDLLKCLQQTRSEKEEEQRKKRKYLTLLRYSMVLVALLLIIIVMTII